MKKIIIIYLLLVVSLLVGVTYQEYNPNDGRFKILALRKAQERLKVSEVDYTSAKELLKSGFMSKRSFDDIELQYQNDKLNFQQYLLSVVFDKPHLAILKAEKFQNELGETLVNLQIRNSSSSDFKLEQDLLEQAQMDGLSLDAMHDVFISLQDELGNIISQPYEFHVNKLESNQNTEIEFTLLKDVDAVTVTANYGDKVDTKRIWLKRRSSEGAITVTPNLYSQEVEFGFTASYSLNLEYFGDKRVRCNLKVTGLPKGIEGSFVNPLTGTNVSTTMVSSVNPIKQYNLNIIIPEESGAGVTIDKLIPFTVEVANAQGKILGELDLELIPRGKAEIDMMMNNMYFTVSKSDTLDIYPLTIENLGQIDIRNISLELSLPPSWEYVMKPDKIAILKAGEKQKMKLQVIPASDVLKGIYQVSVSAKGQNNGKIVSTQKKDIKIEIEHESNPLLTLILIVIVLGFIGGVIYVVTRFSKS